MEADKGVECSSQLRCLSLRLDVVCNDGDIFEIQRGVNLVHEI